MRPRQHHPPSDNPQPNGHADEGALTPRAPLSFLDDYCDECGGTILAPSAAGVERGSCRCIKPGRIKALLRYGTPANPGGSREYAVEWNSMTIHVDPPTLDRAWHVLRELRQGLAPELICAWCQRKLRIGPPPATHGICEACCMKTFGFAPSDEESHDTVPLVSREFRRMVFGMMAVVLLGIVLLVFNAFRAHAQVTAIAELHQGITEVRVGNPSAWPLAVRLEGLFRDKTTDSTPVTLGDSVHALITPTSFTLQPGEVQTIRIRVRDSVSVGELLRLATLLTPIDTSTAQGARLIIATRLVTKVVAR